MNFRGGMESSVAVMTPEIAGTLGHERPIPLDQRRHQFPVLRSRKTKPRDVRCFQMPARSGQVGKLLGKAFVDQELHASWEPGPALDLIFLNGTVRSSRVVAPAGGLGAAEGRPRKGFVFA